MTEAPTLDTELVQEVGKDDSGARESSQGHGPLLPVKIELDRDGGRGGVVHQLQPDSHPELTSVEDGGIRVGVRFSPVACLTLPSKDTQGFRLIDYQTNDDIARRTSTVLNIHCITERFSPAMVNYSTHKVNRSILSKSSLPQLPNVSK